MKELSIEEKAKRYDKALEIMKAYYNRTQFSSISDSKEELKTIEKAFPELKESEDERIKKALISQYQGDGCLCNFGIRISYKDIVTWLEKQGEQKPADKIEPIVVRDFNSVFSREQVEEIDKRIEESQRLYNAKLRDAMRKVEDFPMTD